MRKKALLALDIVRLVVCVAAIVLTVKLIEEE